MPPAAHRFARVGHVVALAALLASASPAHGVAQTPAPPWRKSLVPWESSAEDARPWRSDDRLAGRSEPGYPDDFQVRFAHPDSAHGGKPEFMWVRVIAYDAPSDLFLGILINTPFHLREPRENDNVVFSIAPDRRLLAQGAPHYADAGWPAGPPTAFTLPLREGIRAYRDGHNGHNMPGIDRCISVLTRAIHDDVTRATPDEQFVGHFVLGRCLAERYKTERAMAQFREAIALRPDDLDSHMALLAELTIMNHRRKPVPSPAASASLERQFQAELSEISTRFPAEPMVRRVRDALFDSSQLSAEDAASPTERARLARIGYATFRWKRR